MTDVLNLAEVRLTLDSGAGPVKILRGIDLAVPADTRIAVVGPSGSGKSTLIAVAAGLERPTSGRIRVCGADVGAMEEDGLAAFRRDHVGIVFQSFRLVATMTALENTALPLELAGRRDAFAVARESLAAVGLAARTGHYPSQLSGGEQQRVAIARAFVARPPLLLADEPTGNLDQDTGHMVIELMFRIRAETGATLVMVTHDAELAGRVDRIVHLVDGRIAQD